MSFVMHERTLADLPWRELGVVSCWIVRAYMAAGEHGEAHIAAGAKRKCSSHPGGNDLDAHRRFGVSQNQLRAEHHYCLKRVLYHELHNPVIKLLDDAYGIESGTVTTIHSAMNDRKSR